MSGKDAVVSPVDAAAAGLGVSVAAVAAVLFRIAGVRSAKRSRGKAHVRSGRTDADAAVGRFSESSGDFALRSTSVRLRRRSLAPFSPYGEWPRNTEMCNRLENGYNL